MNRLAEMARKMAWEHPAQVMAETATLPESPFRLAVLKHTAGSAVGRMPGATWQWVSTLSAEAGRDAVAETITSTAAMPEAVEWLPSLTPGPVRDVAVAAFVSCVWKEQPEAAVRWATTISGAERREQALSAILPEVWQLHPEAAEKALSESALSPEEQARCRSLRPAPPPEQ